MNDLLFTKMIADRRKTYKKYKIIAVNFGF